MPRFAFEKFPLADDRLTTQMKSVGEVMAIGRTFQESFQKALRGLEVGVDGLNQRTRDRETIETELGDPGPERIWYVGDAFENGFTLEEVNELTHIDPWFLAQIKEIVDIEMELDDRSSQTSSGTSGSSSARVSPIAGSRTSSRNRGVRARVTNGRRRVHRWILCAESPQPRRICIDLRRRVRSPPPRGRR